MIPNILGGGLVLAFLRILIRNKLLKIERWTSFTTVKNISGYWPIHKIKLLFFCILHQSQYIIADSAEILIKLETSQIKM